MTDPPMELSPAGEQRKESILAMAKVHASQRRQRRRAAQTLAATAAIIFALAVPVLLLRPHHHQAKPIAVVPNVHPQIEQHLTKSPFKPRVVVVKIETDPQIIDRLAIPPQPARWKKIGDDELLRDLASAHQPAGLAYVGDHKPVLLFRTPGPSRGG